MNTGTTLSKMKWTWHRFWILKRWKGSNSKKVAKALQKAGPALAGKITQERLEKARELLWGKN